MAGWYEERTPPFVGYRDDASGWSADGAVGDLVGQVRSRDTQSGGLAIHDRFFDFRPASLCTLQLCVVVIPILLVPDTLGLGDDSRTNGYIHAPHLEEMGDGSGGMDS